MLSLLGNNSRSSRGAERKGERLRRIFRSVDRKPLSCTSLSLLPSVVLPFPSGLPWCHSANLLFHRLRRHARKPIPSPLSLTAAVSPASPTFSSRSDLSPATTPHHLGRSIPYSPTYSGEGPRSPREKLDELLAAEKTFYQSDTSSVSNTEVGASRFVPYSYIIHSAKTLLR